MVHVFSFKLFLSVCSETSKFSENWAQVLLAQGAVSPDPFFLRQAIENYKLKVDYELHVYDHIHIIIYTHVFVCTACVHCFLLYCTVLSRSFRT